MKTKHLFSGRAIMYARNRPDYPQALRQWLESEVGLSSAHVADIGAGTGIFSRFLAYSAATVIAVEPNADMRSAFLSGGESPANLSIVTGSESATTLPEASVDLVTAAQAFHWFDPEAFKTECQRILSPAGRVLLVWNVLEAGHPIEDDIRTLCDDLNLENNAVRSEWLDITADFSAFFAGGMYEMRIFPNPLSLDRDTFIGRYLSASYAPLKHETHHNAFRSGLDKIFERYAHNGQIAMPYLTDAYLGKV